MKNYALQIVILAALVSISGSNASAQNKDCYLTKNSVQGNAVLNACATGYHTAAATEIYVGIPYNATLGQRFSDSSGGAPLLTFGWIRTGQNRSDNGATCSGWTSNAPSNTGWIGGFVTHSVNLSQGNKNFIAMEVAFSIVLDSGDGVIVPHHNCDVPKPVWCVHN